MLFESLCSSHRVLLQITACFINKQRNLVNTRLHKVYKGILRCEIGAQYDLQKSLRRELQMIRHPPCLGPFASAVRYLYPSLYAEIPEEIPQALIISLLMKFEP